MNDFDYLSLDGRSLRTFLVVLEEGSVTRAADRLGVTQSAVSHTLDKLRLVLGDALFVRAGRGIQPTTRAKSLREPIQSILDDLKSLTVKRAFDPKRERMEFTIAANDFQRELLFPALVRRFVRNGVDIRFRFIPAGIPAAGLLHEARCQLIISPFPPDSTEIVQQLLFRDRLAVFFDGKMRKAPKTRDEFVASDYIEVQFPDYTSAFEAFGSVDMSQLKAPRITVPNLGDLAAFMKGTKFITAKLSGLRLGPLRELDVAKVPFKSDPLALYMIWHRRDDDDPAHQWLRGLVKTQARGASAKLAAKKL